MCCKYSVQNYKSIDYYQVMKKRKGPKPQPQPEPQKQIDFCILCSCKRQQVSKKFFANCEHSGTCVRCAEKKMMIQLKDGRMPTCIVSVECQAPMVTNENSLFQYFDKQSKQEFYRFEKRHESPRQPEQKKSLPRECKRQNCHGIIQGNRCKKCSTRYCQKCHKFDHPITERCKQTFSIELNQGGPCPLCGDDTHPAFACKRNRMEMCATCAIF